jgi:hypothetical protein
LQLEPLQRTANLDDFFLDVGWWGKIEDILEAEGRLRSDLDVSMHNCSLNHFNQSLHALVCL